MFARSPRSRKCAELNIGHFIIGEAMFVGLEAAVKCASRNRHRARQGGRMIIGIGQDMCDIERIEKSLDRVRRPFQRRVFTEVERQRADRRKAACAHLCQAFRRQGGLRQGARHRRAARGVHWQHMGVVNLPIRQAGFALTGGGGAPREAHAAGP
jgi:holo-[acyl-carrier protein] synthase